MSHAKTTRKSVERSSAFGVIRETPGILLARSPEGASAVDRSAVDPPFTLGRSGDNNFAIQDDKVSSRHFQITKDDNGFWIEDLGSTNGTFLNGAQVFGPKSLKDGDVIRMGGSILVFLEDAQKVLEPAPLERFEMTGPFHSCPIVRDLKEAALSFRHILLAGPSGVGKELAAKALASMLGERSKPLTLISHNCARFASEDEAASTLFGVGAKVFTNVESRPGLIEHAGSGILFLDEIHNLPGRVQRSLLRVIEDGIVTRIGETAAKQTNARFVFASNAAPPTFSLASDLLARLRVVPIPSIRDRIADVPFLFDRLLEATLARRGLSGLNVVRLLGGDHYEALCLDGFENENVRGIIDVADRLVTRIAAGSSPSDALVTVFSERFAEGKVAERYSATGHDGRSASHYEQHREIITAVFLECRGNLSAMERALNDRGIRCTRRWLGIFADKWGLREQKKA
jgi:MoxR-like ATPase